MSEVTVRKQRPKHLAIKLSRAKLESLVDDLVERTMEPCRKALKDAVARIVTDSRLPGEPKQAEGSAFIQLWDAFASSDERAAMAAAGRTRGSTLRRRLDGWSATALLRQVRIPAASLGDADLPVPMARIINLLEAASIAAGNPSFGLLMAQARGFSVLGPVALMLGCLALIAWQPWISMALVR